ncbi:hypothetical protein BP5796_08753 [Coleophoma crateriformis]|uniref:Uncharacterized protein n=1 Tax=Coleophoma crateriformis TaxID=565419 RepID=A0A3D8R8Q2_9HELO|nr:hypothetical protein BP5796_08753 [Coleophoma crateriformis]
MEGKGDHVEKMNAKFEATKLKIKQAQNLITRPNPKSDDVEKLLEAVKEREALYQQYNSLISGGESKILSLTADLHRKQVTLDTAIQHMKATGRMDAKRIAVLEASRIPVVECLVQCASDYQRLREYCEPAGTGSGRGGDEGEEPRTLKRSIGSRANSVDEIGRGEDNARAAKRYKENNEKREIEIEKREKVEKSRAEKAASLTKSPITREGQARSKDK